MDSRGPGATILGCAGPALASDEARFFREADPWGFILFSRNIEAPDQIRRLTGSLREAVGRDAPVLIDQEGGRVQRLRAPHWREYLPPLDQVERCAPGEATRSLWLRYRLIAGELRALGIDANCAPTADIAGPDTHPFLRNRCFGTDAASVVAGARATAEGLLAGGVLPVLKHIPGHGRAVTDSHLALPHVDAPWDELARTDFAPFAALADLPMAMTAHIVYSAIDAEAPATTSPRMIGVIREDIGFDGLLMSDDISMEALSGEVRARSEAAILAGCDVILHCNGDRAEMEAVAAAAGRLAGTGLARADAALSMRRAPEPADWAAMEAELSGLLREPDHA